LCCLPANIALRANDAIGLEHLFEGSFFIVSQTAPALQLLIDGYQ
jgi:hypothetical protein